MIISPEVLKLTDKPEKQKCLHFSPLLKQLFSKLAFSMSSIDKSAQLLKKFFLSWRCLKVFIILTILLTVASDRQIGSGAINTFQDGPFGRVVEAGLY